MTTAREKLYEEMVVMIASPAGPTSESEIRKTMTRYRVQTKPGIDIPVGATARDALGDRLLELWRGGPGGQAPDVKAKIGTAIDEFRMQLKGSSSPSPSPQAGAKPRPTGFAGLPRIPVAAVEDDEREPDSRDARDRRVATEPRRDPSYPPARAASGRAQAPGGSPAMEPQALGAGDPPPASMRGRGRSSAEPVAGGPRKRGRTRGECPKCHSMGVVLARSYSGDEYFSCIYCGWQAYKPAEEDDPNASLAVRLLGQSPTETSRE